jgi:protein-L-isoaspartate(D-aspartate) O-methyltransferase
MGGYSPSRKRMVKMQLIDRGISSPAVIAAMSRVQRHLFVEETMRSRSYEDTPLFIGYDQTISQPYTVARMSELLEAVPGMSVLEIGTGSGYQSAILHELGLKVYSVERLPELHQISSRLLSDLGYQNVRLKLDDGTFGWPEYAPFDRIIVTAGSPVFPEPLMEQLADSGIMVIPVGPDERRQRMMVVRKKNGQVIQQDKGEVSFVKLVGTYGHVDKTALPKKNMPTAEVIASAGMAQDERDKSPANKVQLPLAAREPNLKLAHTLERIRYKIFVMSGKGGVGKSSVTVNLAAALAELGFKVGILDVDLHGPSVPRMLGLDVKKKVAINDGLFTPVEFSQKLKVLSMDILLDDCNKAVIWRGPKKNAAIQQFLAEANWGDLDFLFIDSPPGTGDEHLAVLHLIPEVLCLLVTTPQEIALADVRKTINFLQLAKARILGVIENMGSFSCPHCGVKINLFPPEGAFGMAREYNLSFLGTIPLDPEVARHADKGIPAVLMPEGNPVKTALFALAESVKNASIAILK